MVRGQLFAATDAADSPWVLERDFHDFSNAFGSIEWAEPVGASAEFMRYGLAEYGQQRYLDAVISLPSTQGPPMLFQPTCG
eukprot:2990127-Pyramimonas_sp.AAC.1